MDSNNTSITGNNITGNIYHIYTDGACRNNQEPDKRTAAWAFVVFNSSMERKGSKSAFLGNATNNEAELIAMIEALKWGSTKKLVVYTDSQYVHKGLTEWITGWKRRGWKTSSNEVVKNLDLWQELDSLYNPDNHTLIKVKGHSGDKGNTIVDSLCNVVLDNNCLPEWLQ